MKLIKGANRNEENNLHWNLDAEYLEPLKEFLTNDISEWMINYIFHDKLIIWKYF